MRHHEAVEVALSVSGGVLMLALLFLALGAYGRLLTRRHSEEELRDPYWRWTVPVLFRRLMRPGGRVALVAAVAAVVFALADALLDAG
jgi:hypothetical protein